MWHRAEVVLTDVSEERIASIFRVEGKIRKSASEASVRDVKSRLRAMNQREHESVGCQPVADFLYTGDGGETFLRNVG
jgi:hypothetical protein